MTPADISVVIPTLNEVGSIKSCIESARLAGATQIIVVDADSDDETIGISRLAGATAMVRSEPGRGIQLNRGAAEATGEVILFLHADSQLGSGCLSQICQRSNVVWGAFRQRIDAPQRSFRGIERGNALRVTVRRMPFGDQAVFVRREIFQQQGGFAQIPLMEDYEFASRMKKVAAPVLLDGPVTISARRWQENGVIRQTFHNWMIQVAYRLGVSPEALAQFYRNTA